MISRIYFSANLLPIERNRTLIERRVQLRFINYTLIAWYQAELNEGLKTIEKHIPFIARDNSLYLDRYLFF